MHGEQACDGGTPRGDARRWSMAVRVRRRRSDPTLIFEDDGGRLVSEGWPKTLARGDGGDPAQLVTVMVPDCALPWMVQWQVILPPVVGLSTYASFPESNLTE